MALTPFDFINTLSHSKKNIFENEKDYNSYMINRGFSYFQDTIFYANEMNLGFYLPQKMQHDFYLHAIPSRKRFSKWHKAEKDADITFLQEYYNANASVAREYRKLLTDDQLSEMKKTRTKGGKND